MLTDDEDRTTVDRILTAESLSQASRAELASTIKDETALYRLAEEYNWNDGFEVPLAIVQNQACDLGLALMLFWEIDEPKLYVKDPDSEFLASPDYVPESQQQAKLEFCRILTEGLRESRFAHGANQYDTCFFGEELFEDGSRQAKIREIKTRKALQEYEECFLRPCLRSSDR